MGYSKNTISKIVANRAITASYALNADRSIFSGSFTGSLLGTASWAQSASQALSASYVPLLAGPNISINYQLNGISITGSSTGDYANGPSGAIQFASSSLLSGSANFLFIKNTNTVLLTGSLYVTGSTIISGTLQIISNNNNQTQPSMEVNTDGVFIIGLYSSTPTPVEGGFIYSGSDYYLGFP